MPRRSSVAFENGKCCGDLYACRDMADLERWLAAAYDIPARSKHTESGLRFDHPGPKNATPTRGKRIRQPPSRLVPDGRARGNYVEDRTPATLATLDVATPHPDGDILPRRPRKRANCPAKCPTCRDAIEVVRKPFYENAPDQQCRVCLQYHSVESLVHLKCGHLLCPRCLSEWRRVCS